MSIYQNLLVIIFALIKIYTSKDALLILNYQMDFLFGGRLKPIIENLHQSKIDQIKIEESLVSKNIQGLIELFNPEPIMYSAYKHPENQISFLNYHLNSNIPQSAKKFVKDNLFVWIIYELDQPLKQYKIKQIIYSEEPGDYDQKAETDIVYKQFLMPDNCVKYENKIKKKKSKQELQGIYIEESIKKALKKRLNKQKERTVNVIHLGADKSFEEKSPVGIRLEDHMHGSDVIIPNEKFYHQLVSNQVSRLFLVGTHFQTNILETVTEMKEFYPHIQVYVIPEACTSADYDSFDYREFEKPETFQMISLKQVATELNKLNFEPKEETIIQEAQKSQNNFQGYGKKSESTSLFKDTQPNGYRLLL